MILLLLTSLLAPPALAEEPTPEPAWDLPTRTPRPLLRPLRRSTNTLPVVTQEGLPLPLAPYGPLPAPTVDDAHLPLPEWRRLDARRVTLIGTGGAVAALAAYGLVAALGPATRP